VIFISYIDAFQLRWVLAEEEYNFLREICLAALSADKKNLKFVAAVDENGKLLVGEYNKSQFFKNNNNSLLIKSSIFYLHYLIPAIKRQCKTDCSSFHDLIHNDNMFHFKLKDLGNNVYLLVAVLTEKKDRYLCMYVESYPSPKVISYGQIISKMSSTF
jgi:hypothetical protein